MRFGVLGPLAVWTDDGTPVAVPGSKVRALVADLVAHRGDLVPAARLIDDIWGTELPNNPPAALQVKVSQLRKALADAEPGARDLVVYRSSGYLLDVERDGTDVGRFHALTERARAEADAATRAELLADALDLWRGPALADFADEPFAGPPVARLEEDRLAAVELRREARRERGGHAHLIAELEDLVARHTLRERLRAVHMRALYRAGRQSDALASYGELRDRLADELGLDPGAELTALHQAVLARDPALEAPAAGAPVPRGNLPAQLTELVGRDEDVAEVRSLLDKSRLVTLTGPGGVGKTRLAVETAARLAGTFPDGAWLVEPAPLAAATRESLVEAVTSALWLRDDATVGQPLDPADRLADALRAKDLLLVLNNCEYVIEPVAELVDRLLRAAPRLRVLATSQGPLGLAGEVRWEVAPLDSAAAVELFVARAAAVSPGFRLDEDNAEDVAVLCRRLDGIPLVLELAANRVRAVGVSGLVERLDDRFRLLATGHRGAAPRQRTLRAMIDWSWDLLTDPERAVLRRLAAHGESATLEAAEAVCAGGEVAHADVLDLLTRLVDRSLVVPVDAGGPRYRLLESVAAYCLDKVEPGERAEVRRRHRAFYVAFAERAEPHLRAGDQRRWLERLDRESGNLRAALDGAVRDGDQDTALRMVAALAWYWCLRGRFAEARRSLEAAVALGADGPLLAAALAWHAGIAVLQGDSTDRTARIGRVVELFERLPPGRARAFWFLDYAVSRTGDVAAEGDLVNRALTEFEAAGDRWGTAAALSVRADQALARGDLAALRRDGERSAALFREVGDRWGQSKASSALAALAEIGGDYERAARLHRDGLRAAEELGLWPEVVERLSGLGRIALLTGDFAAAREFHERALRLAAEQNAKTAEVGAELGLALGARREATWIPLKHTCERRWSGAGARTSRRAWAMHSWWRNWAS